MKELNTLRLKDNGNISGKVKFLTTPEMNLTFEPNPHAVNENSPQFLIYVENLKVGAGWAKKIEKGDLAGKELITFSIDDPSFDKPLNLTAFPTKEIGIFEVSFNRPRQKDAA